MAEHTVEGNITVHPRRSHQRREYRERDEPSNVVEWIVDIAIGAALAAATLAIGRRVLR